MGKCNRKPIPTRFNLKKEVINSNNDENVGLDEIESRQHSLRMLGGL